MIAPFFLASLTLDSFRLTGAASCRTKVSQNSLGVPSSVFDTRSLAPATIEVETARTKTKHHASHVLGQAVATAARFCITSVLRRRLSLNGSAFPTNFQTHPSRDEFHDGFGSKPHYAPPAIVSEKCVDTAKLPRPLTSPAAVLGKRSEVRLTAQKSVRCMAGNRSTTDGKSSSWLRPIPRGFAAPSPSTRSLARTSSRRPISMGRPRPIVPLRP